jgi:hypothetical protein
MVDNPDVIYDNERSIYQDYCRRKEKCNRYRGRIKIIQVTSLELKLDCLNLVSPSSGHEDSVIAVLQTEHHKVSVIETSQVAPLPISQDKVSVIETSQVAPLPISQDKVSVIETSQVAPFTISQEDEEQNRDDVHPKLLSDIFLKELKCLEPFFRPGLQNSEYHCYFNSYLQVLFYNQIFAVDFMIAQLLDVKKLIPEDERESRSRFDDFLRELFFEMKYCSKRFITPNQAFILQFYENRQEYMFDFREKLLDGITFANYDSLPFEKLYSECNKCKINWFERDIECGNRLRRIEAEAVNNDFVNDLFKDDCVSHEKYCEECKSVMNHTSTSKFMLNRTPYLELNVYRDVDQENLTVCRQMSSYVNSFVDIRENITYNLISIIYRPNYEVESGHYISLVKDWYTNKWYNYNDAIVSECSDPFADCYRLGAVYLCYASSAASEKAMQDYEKIFERFSKTFPSPANALPRDTLATNYNINCVRRLFVQEGPLFALPKKWLQFKRKSFPEFVVCSCCVKVLILDKFLNDYVLVPLSVVIALFKALPAKATPRATSRFQLYKGLKCSNCSSYFASLIPYNQIGY